MDNQKIEAAVDGPKTPKVVFTFVGIAVLIALTVFASVIGSKNSKITRLEAENKETSSRLRLCEGRFNEQEESLIKELRLMSELRLENEALDKEIKSLKESITKNSEAYELVRTKATGRVDSIVTGTGSNE